MNWRLSVTLPQKVIYIHVSLRDLRFICDIDSSRSPRCHLKHPSSYLLRIYISISDEFMGLLIVCRWGGEESEWVTLLKVSENFWHIIDVIMTGGHH